LTTLVIIMCCSARAKWTLRLGKTFANFNKRYNGYERMEQVEQLWPL